MFLLATRIRSNVVSRTLSLVAGTLLYGGIGTGCSSVADMTPRPAPEEWERSGAGTVSASPGDEAYLRGDFAEAIRLYSQDLEGPGAGRSRGSAVAWRNYGHALLGEGDVDAARRAFEESVRRSPPNEPPYGDAQLGLARCALVQERFEDAVRAAQAAFDTGTTDEAWAAQVLGLAQQRLGRFEDADRNYLRAMAVGGDSEPAWRARERKGVRTFSVQVGSYRSVKAAGEMQDRLRESGFESRLERIERGPDLLYRVMVGSYASYAEAKAMRDQLLDRSGVADLSDAIVFP